jgi:ADP-heptose:LPS heptosyltransferase
MKIALFPYARTMRNVGKHPKNYPWWPELVELLHAAGHTLIQLGVEGEDQLVDDFRVGLSYDELCRVVRGVDTWIGVDSFGQHLGWSLGVRGIAIFGQSDPLIFGHIENVNLLKDRKYLREKQFWLWEQCEANDECWVTPVEVMAALDEHIMK